MPFLNDLVVRAGEKYAEWVLEKDFVYVTNDGGVIEVPAGFVTDLASIPRVFHAVIPVNGKHRKAAVVHDWLYVSQIMSRAESDKVFLKAMEESGVRWSLRWVMYSAVRSAGWLYWNERKSKLTEA